MFLYFHQIGITKEKNNGRCTSDELFLYLSPSIARALSSAGSERLPYKEEVVGSNPTEPTVDLVACAGMHHILLISTYRGSYKTQKKS